MTAVDLPDSEQRYRLLFDSIDEGFCTIEVLFDADGRPIDYRFLEVNPAFGRQTGWRDVAGKRIREFLPNPEGSWLEAFGRIARTGQAERFEQEAPALGRTYGVHAFPVGPPADRRVGVLIQDVTERKRIETTLRENEAHLRALLGEVQHRVRNTLAVVRSIARRTAENSADVEEMAAHLQGRLDAFARVQAMATRRPGAGVDLTALVADELLAHAMEEGERLSIDGPEVCLKPRPAETVSLAIHELATNAVKYGALRNAHGRIAVRWAIEDGMLRLGWTERGLGAPIAPPTRRGFGLELFERTLAYELGAQVSVAFPAEGVEFEALMPVERVVA